MKSPSNTIPVLPSEFWRNTLIGSARTHASCAASPEFAVDAHAVLRISESNVVWNAVAFGRLKLPLLVPLWAIAWLNKWSSRPP